MQADKSDQHKPGVNIIAGKNTSGMIRAALLVTAMTGIAVVVFYYGFTSQQPESTVVRVGVLPDQSHASLRQRYNPLLEYLADQSGIETELIIPTNYQEAVDLFGKRKIDLAYMGGLTFVQAQAYFDAEPLVMREIDTRFTSWFLARPELAQKPISELTGKSLVFGSKLSTSGHLMPRHFLQRKWNLQPESFFSEVGYSGAHDKTVYLVRDGRYDIGAVNAAIARQMMSDGRIGRDELTVVWQTPPYPDYVWAVRPDLDETLKNRLRDAFLRLDSDKPADNRILTRLGARVFFPAGTADFRTLSDIARRRGLMENTSQ